MQFTVSRETLSEISEGLGFLIRGMKKIQKSIAVFGETEENQAGHFGNSSPEGKNTRAVTTIKKTGILLPKVSSAGFVPPAPGSPTLLHADLTAEAVQWLHRSKFSVAGVPGALPFGEEMMGSLLRNRLRGDRNHNVWVLYDGGDPGTRRCWTKASHDSLKLIKQKLEVAMLRCFDYVVDTRTKPSRFNERKWKRRMNILRWKDSIPTVVQLEKFARSQHDMLPALRTL